MVALVALTVADTPDSWRAAGFDVADDGRCRIGAVEIHCTGATRRDGDQDAPEGILGWRFSGTAGASVDGDLDGDLDGIATTVATTPVAGTPVEPGTHPNGTVAIDHVVVLSPDPDRTVAAFASIGLAPRRTRLTDTYGAPMRQIFFRAGEVVIELIGPDEGTWGDDPASFFGLAHTVADLDETVRVVGEAAGRIKDAVQPGRRIMTLRHRALGMTVATAFMTPEPP